MHSIDTLKEQLLNAYLDAARNAQVKNNEGHAIAKKEFKRLEQAIWAIHPGKDGSRIIDDVDELSSKLFRAEMEN